MIKGFAGLQNSRALSRNIFVSEPLVRALFKKGFRREATHLIKVAGAPVAVYQLAAQETRWFLSRIEILPPLQNRGLATGICSKLLRK